MAYATAAEFGGSTGYLSQVDIADADTLTKVNAILGRAESIVVDEMGFTYVAWPAASEVEVRAGYGAYFTLPAHQAGSVTLVETIGGTDLVGYWEELDSGTLYSINSSGVEGNWNAGRYAITAVWGYGPTPASVTEVTLQIAVNLWRQAESGDFTDVIGAGDGGAVGYRRALTMQQKMILVNARNKVVPLVI